MIVLGAEAHLPYDRPPLSKQVLAGDWAPERASLRTPDALSALNAEFVLGDPAVRLDARARTVHTESGRALTADAVVLATGLRPRTLPGQDGLAGVHVLRTLDDALALRAELTPDKRVVVVGDGVLGAEIAATVCGLGVPVTLAGPQPAPLAYQFGPLAAGLLAELHAARGVHLRLGAAVTGLSSLDGRVTGVRLATGEDLPAEVVVVAFGAAPATDWLAGSGVLCDNGVVCDSRCRAAEGVYPAGDVARWHHEGLDVLLRLENRTNATEQAVASRGTSSVRTGRTRRCRTSGPTSSTRGSTCTGRSPRTRKYPLWMVTCARAGSSRSTAAAARSPACSAGTCPSRPGCAGRRSPARSSPEKPETPIRRLTAAGPGATLFTLTSWKGWS